MPPENNATEDAGKSAAPTAEAADLLRKQIATARTLLLIIAIVTLLSASLLLPQLPGNKFLINILLTSTISVIYFLLAAYTKKKPYTAILLGLYLLGLSVMLDIVWNPFGPFNRWQTKTLTLLLLLLGIPDSKDAQRKMRIPPASATASISSTPPPPGSSIQPPSNSATQPPSNPTTPPPPNSSSAHNHP